jgi:hypothetical protein
MLIMNDFYVYITFDIDQDFDPDSKDYYNRSGADFSSFGEKFSLIIDKLNNIPFSVFIRADHQIKSIYGSYDHLLKNNPILIRKIIQSNGELNWHIHIYEETNGKWMQIKNEQKIVDSFLEDYHEVSRIDELNSHIVRIGECLMNNSLMEAISNCGIKIDSTALPGRKRNDKDKYFDWELTKDNLYNPSKSDYRVGGNDAYSLVEVPMSTILMKTSYDIHAIKRYFNLSFKTDILFQNFDKFVKNNNSLISITHPFEVLSKGTHGLISYDISTFEKNLNILKDRIDKSGKNVVFRRISEIL